MTGTRTVVATVVTVLGLGVAGCAGEDPEPNIAPPTPSSPSASPSTSGASVETPPEMPEEAKGRDAAAAEAFVKFYWDMVNYAQETGEVNELLHLAENCPTCDGGTDSIRSIYRDGGVIRGGEGSLSGLETTFLQGEVVRAVVEFTLSNSRQTVDYPGTGRDVIYPKGELEYQAIVRYTPDGWRVVYLGER